MSTIGRANVDQSTNEGASFMHLARRAWCRTYQTVFRIALPVLPYTEPRILEHAEEVPAVLQKRSIHHVLIVTDPALPVWGSRHRSRQRSRPRELALRSMPKHVRTPRSQTWRKRHLCIERAPARPLSALAAVRPWTAPRAWARASRSQRSPSTRCAACCVSIVACRCSSPFPPRRAREARSRLQR